MHDVIATRKLLGVRPDGESFSIVVEIGKPTPFGDPNDNWRCPLSVTPLLHHSIEIGGYDSVQALALVIRYVVSQLSDFIDQGGRLLYPGGDEEFKLDPF
jgi:hypothetical protein